MDTGQRHASENDLVNQVRALPLPLRHGPESRNWSARIQAYVANRHDWRSVDGVWCGLLLRAGCWDEAHQRAQDMTEAEGAYWHAIAHRMEPDIGNARYWFAQLGVHPVFEQLASRAAPMLTLAPAAGPLAIRWDPKLFLRLYSEALQKPESAIGAAVLAVHNLEWQLLYDWCGGAR